MLKTHDLQRRALDSLRHTLPELAKALRVSRHTLYSYRQGRRVMPRATRLRLADYIEERGRDLLQLAKELRRAD